MWWSSSPFGVKLVSNRNFENNSRSQVHVRQELIRYGNEPNDVLNEVWRVSSNLWLIACTSVDAVMSWLPSHIAIDAGSLISGHHPILRSTGM